MAGSIAEERIRAKVEAAFRRRWPEARIIHELVLDQGGVRIDLAAVTADRLYVAEIKSERDVLKRLATQVEVATQVAQEVWVVVGEKHVERVKALKDYHRCVPRVPPFVRKDGSVLDTQLVRNDERIVPLGWCHLKAEGEGDELRWIDAQPRSERRFSPSAMLDMLHRSELAWLTKSGSRATREFMIRLAIEELSGGEVRRGVCAMLLTRSFPRADPPIANGVRVASPSNAHRPSDAEPAPLVGWARS